MTQPYCYWTLIAPYIRILGLYSNVDGLIDAQQQLWLQQQLTSCPKDKWLILAVHHPCYSLDTTHGGYLDICFLAPPFGSPELGKLFAGTPDHFRDEGLSSLFWRRREFFSA